MVADFHEISIGQSDDVPLGQDLPARARQILAKPGIITGADALELRDLSNSAHPAVLKNFDNLGYACFIGALGDALVLLTAQNRPDLTRKQRPFGHTYVTLLVLGYTARVGLDGCNPDHYIKLLDVLLSAGIPVDSPDILGMSALHYAVFVPRTCGIVKVLLRHKANVNLQDRFGASPLLMAIGKGAIEVIPALLDAGGNLDVTDGEGSSPRSVYLTSPAKVSNVVKSWLVKHEGKNSVLQGDRCSKCGIRSASVKRCARCRSRLYCSPECQKVDWKEHKKSCQPFEKEGNLLVVTPSYTYGASTISTVLSTFGDSSGLTPSGRLKANVRDGRNMVLRIQASPLGGNRRMLVYNKKRSFECFLEYTNNPVAYERIEKIINEKGILGEMAYFAAELRSKDELAINVAGCLPEARF